MDEAFDRAHGLQSIPTRFGKAKALRISGVLHILAFGCLVMLYAQTLRASLITILTLAVIGGLLFLEHRLSDDVDLAFFKINAVLGFGILGLIATGVGGLL